MNYPRQQDTSIAPRSVRVGAIGLGVGTIATYGLPGDLFRFYEIDPEVIRVASGKYGYFSFLSDSRAGVEIVQGDARISLERELANGQAQNYDVLVVDAFSGDVVPIHLLTKEAFELYLKHLRDEDSVIAVHVSNRSVDLASVVAKEAEYFHLYTAFVNAPGYQSAVVPSDLFLPSKWILLSRNSRVLSLPAISRASGPLPAKHAVPLWTDDYSNLLQILW
jgi:spermidine synthase